MEDYLPHPTLTTIEKEEDRLLLPVGRYLLPSPIGTGYTFVNIEENVTIKTGDVVRCRLKEPEPISNNSARIVALFNGKYYPVEFSEDLTKRWNAKASELENSDKNSLAVVYHYQEFTLDFGLQKKEEQWYLVDVCVYPTKVKGESINGAFFINLNAKEHQVKKTETQTNIWLGFEEHVGKSAVITFEYKGITYCVDFPENLTVEYQEELKKTDVHCKEYYFPLGFTFKDYKFTFGLSHVHETDEDGNDVIDWFISVVIVSSAEYEANYPTK
jgi:hypothetical protein